MMTKKLTRLGLSTFFAFGMFSSAWAEGGMFAGQAFSIPNLYLSTDSEGFFTGKHRMGYYPMYEHGEKYTGVEYQYSYFSQGDFSANAHQFSIVTRAINPRTGLGYKASAGYSQGSDHKLFTTDSSYGGRLTDTTAFEVFVNRDRVETQNSIRNGVNSTLVGVSLEQQLFNRLTVVGLLGNMYLSDSNRRTIFRAKLAYEIIPDSGITAQLRYRQFRDSDDTPGNYFNPRTYNETMLAVGMRKRVDGWMFNGVAGLGRQYIDDQSGTVTHLLEFAATSPVKEKQYYFNTRLGYGRSAGFQGPNYSYGYIQEQLIFPF